MTHTHDEYGPCDTLDGCSSGGQPKIIEDCGCTHSPCPCEETDCSYYGATCNLCPLHAAAPELLEALKAVDAAVAPTTLGTNELSMVFRKARIAIAKAEGS